MLESYTRYSRAEHAFTNMGIVWTLLFAGNASIHQPLHGRLYRKPDTSYTFQSLKAEHL